VNVQTSNTAGFAASGATPGRRQLLHGAVIAGFVCASWFAAVRPMEHKLAAKRAELQSINSQLADFESGIASEPPLAKAIQGLTDRGRLINTWTACSGDASKLYEAFRTLASKCSVRIERVEPSSAGRGSHASSKDPNTTELFGYTIEITGTYQNVARFIDACEQQLGVTKVASFHMSPVNNAAPGAGGSPADPAITAIIETAHLKLAIQGMNPDSPAAAAPLAQGSGS
jgi:hypothetical protein